jgi:hypothetical protein
LEAIENLSAKEIRAALDEAKGRKSVAIPVRDKEGRDLFKIRIFNNRIAIAAIDKNFYRTHFSLWTTPPLEVSEEKADRQIPPEGTAGARRSRMGPASARGPWRTRSLSAGYGQRPAHRMSWIWERSP